MKIFSRLQNVKRILMMGRTSNLTIGQGWGKTAAYQCATVLRVTTIIIPSWRNTDIALMSMYTVEILVSRHISPWHGEKCCCKPDSTNIIMTLKIKLSCSSSMDWYWGGK
eukprot:scpid23430/ scgid28725/ 